MRSRRRSRIWAPGRSTARSPVLVLVPVAVVVGCLGVAAVAGVAARHQDGPQDLLHGEAAVVRSVHGAEVAPVLVRELAMAGRTNEMPYSTLPKKQVNQDQQMVNVAYPSMDDSVPAS
uniref:Uncharacterized protein n=2 Tax=Oryza sativa subsp. japonica TaxID=39947 RepID=Q2R958_ORYSJ|nr:hypothetical protein LOC_Os11g09880 [Oryza sativa Japonica Group]ABA91978.1 hypothetical protein LOC_Os11g09880 [Oryza sativa Japonica Group]